MHQGWLEETRAGRGALPQLVEPASSMQLCPFLARCPVRIDGKCNKVAPPRVRLDKGNEILCHHSDSELRHFDELVPAMAVNG
jgi:peptide/nickel transport system ATP-binding protein